MKSTTGDALALLTDAFYSAAVEDSWPAVMRQLRSAINGSKATFGMLDRVSRPGRIFHADCDAAYAELFYDPSLANPILPFLFSGGPQEIATDEAVLPREEFRRTVFFNEWFVPQGDHSVLMCKVPVGRWGTAAIAFQRGGRQPGFDREDMAFLERLAPSISRAAGLCLQLGVARDGVESRTWDLLALGHIVVDPIGRPLAMNSVAEAILASGDSGLGVIGGKVAARESTLGHALRALVAAACRADVAPLPGGGELLVRSESTGAPQLTLTVIPVGGAPMFSVHRAAVILIQDLSAPFDPALEQRLRQLFGLTPKEAELAVALASGLSVKDYARDRGISIVTARTHLAKLFSKTATVRQGQLVALLNRAARVPPGSVRI